MGASHAEQGDGQVSKRSHDLGAISPADAAAVFIIGDIADIMEAVFNGPMASGQAHEAGRSGLLGAEAGNSIDGFGAFFAGDEFGGMALDAKDLAGIGKGQVSGKFGAGPDVADFQPSMGFIDGGVRRGGKPSSPAQRYLDGGSIGYL